MNRAKLLEVGDIAAAQAYLNSAHRRISHVGFGIVHGPRIFQDTVPRLLIDKGRGTFGGIKIVPAAFKFPSLSLRMESSRLLGCTVQINFATMLIFQELRA